MNINRLVQLLLGQTQVFSLFYTVEARFVPATNPVCPWDKPGVERLQQKFMCQKFIGIGKRGLLEKGSLQEKCIF